jgi:hypothetical protein
MHLALAVNARAITCRLARATHAASSANGLHYDGSTPTDPLEAPWLAPRTPIAPMRAAITAPR